jgi:hypothetical protein
LPDKLEFVSDRVLVAVLEQGDALVVVSEGEKRVTRYGLKPRRPEVGRAELILSVEEVPAPALDADVIGE